MIKLKIKPLSVNEAFKGKRINTSKYSKFKRDISKLLPELTYTSENLEIYILFGFSSKLSDLDNCVKTFLDSLTAKYKVDDRYFYKMTVEKTIVSKGSEFIAFEITNKKPLTLNL